MQGHTIDRSLVMRSGNVQRQYQCIDCGVLVEDPEEPGLETESCDASPFG